jgi:hypothetical protein
MIVISGTVSSSPTVVGKAASLPEQSYSSAAFEVQLSIIDHHGIETCSRVTHLPAILGRSAKSDVRLADPWVSGFHCVLNEIDGTLVAYSSTGAGSTMRMSYQGIGSSLDRQE